jgi:hypothetical protein
MSRLLITSFIASLLVFVLPQDNVTLTEVAQDGWRINTTLQLDSIPISGPKDRYHSLSFSIRYEHTTGPRTTPDVVNVDLVSVVKARKLNTDLYVLFLADGRELHFGSSRSAIPKPVPGRPWIGERMVFHMPREDFLKWAEAEKLGVKLGGVVFDFSEEDRDAVRVVAKKIRDLTVQ